MRIYTQHFFTSVKQKTQNDPIFVKNEVYASLLRPYFFLTSWLLIIQMLKFKQKRDMKRPDFRKNDVYTSFTDVLRMSYGCLTNVLRFFTDYSNVKIQNKNEIQTPRFSEK